MTTLVWDDPANRVYETGVDRGVFYLDTVKGVPWNGLTAVTESPSGAEASPQYGDNQKYVILISAEEFSGTIEAFGYPKNFEQCDGSYSPFPGFVVAQQPRLPFGFSYRTRIGNGISGIDYGYKIHIVYNARVQPAEKAMATINDSPEVLTYSWEFSTVPLYVSDQFKPISHIAIDSTQIKPDALATLEGWLYGTYSTRPRLPSIAEIINLTSDFTASEDGSDVGTYLGTAFSEDPGDPGTYILRGPKVTEDNTDVGTYLIGA